VSRERYVQTLGEMRLKIELFRRNAPKSLEEFLAKEEQRAIVYFAIQALVDLSARVCFRWLSEQRVAAGRSYRECFEAAGKAGLLEASMVAELADSAGLRNVLVHEYVDIDISRVHGKIPALLDVFPRFVGRLAAKLGLLEFEHG
jgi:uncharacterized protein YutE (UPF0331/DUF86 family)